MMSESERLLVSIRLSPLELGDRRNGETLGDADMYLLTVGADTVSALS